MTRVHPLTLIGVAVLFLFAAGITIAAFFSLVIPEYRHQAFYAGLISGLVAELGFFGYLSYAIGARPSPEQPDVANRVRLTMLVGLWALAVLIAGGMAAAPGNADTFVSDQIILIQLIITFLLFGAAFLQHRQAAGVQTREVGPQDERRRLECCAGGLDPLLNELQAIAMRRPDQAVELDGLARRIDTLKTRLRAASPAVSRDAGRLSEPVEAAVIEQRLHQLHDAVSLVRLADPEQFGDRLEKARSAVDQALAALRQREEAMTF